MLGESTEEYDQASDSTGKQEQAEGGGGEEGCIFKFLEASDEEERPGGEDEQGVEVPRVLQVRFGCAVECFGVACESLSVIAGGVETVHQVVGEEHTFGEGGFSVASLSQYGVDAPFHPRGATEVFVE